MLQLKLGVLKVRRMKRTIAALIILLLGTGLWVSGTAPSESNLSLASSWKKTSDSMTGGVYHIAIVADLDKASKMAEEKKPKFKSYLKMGTLTRKGDSFSIEWIDTHTITSAHNEAGRGMELSELAVFNGKLWTFDDRSGIAFELANKNGKPKAIPRHLLMEGDGETDKGQKTEWATVKDGIMYIGSFGKEYVGSKGEVTSRNNLWISTISMACAGVEVVNHENWTDKYNVIRKTTNSVHPAYQIIETIEWSAIHRKWFILPRRVSEEAYDESKDEKRGSNIVIKCNEHITECEKFTVGTITPERGFSSAKFVPGTKDSIMVALKSEENEELGTQKTFITAFDLTGKVLLEETEVGTNKYEGLSFV